MKSVSLSWVVLFGLLVFNSCNGGPTNGTTTSTTSTTTTTSTSTTTTSTTTPDPVDLEEGEWIVNLTTTGNAVYPRFPLILSQSGSSLSGSHTSSVSDESLTFVTSGTVDGFGNVTMTTTITNAGSPRAVIEFTGMVSGSGSNQTISGDYTATGPSVPSGTETGTFTMTNTG